MCQYSENRKFADKEIEQIIDWLHRVAVHSRLVHQPVAHGELTGTNVHHGLGGEFGFLRHTYAYGVSSWLK